MKIVVAEKLGKAGLAMLSSQPGWTIVSRDEYSLDPAGQLRDADALIVRSAVRVTDELLDSAPKLRVIGRAGVGVDNIDCDAATRRGIIVMNTPGSSAVAVAEMAIGLMLSLARQIPRASQALHAGRWEKNSLEGTELQGKCMGVIGLGRIGAEVARRASSLGMTVLATDPYASPELARLLGIKLATLEELLPQADYLSLHVGLTPQTRGFINRESIARMKRGVRIVNCARGELVDESALAEALNSGQVAGAALDVFTREPLTTSPLIGVSNAILTPHIAGSTAEAQEAISLQVASEVREYLLHGVVQNAVNVPSVTDIEYAEIRPYMEAARKTASLLGQLFSGNLEEIRIGYEGRVSEWKTALLRNAAVSGVLQLNSPERVNVVNAANAAAERGIRVSEQSSDGPIPAIRVELCGRGVELAARCTVVHKNSERLIELKGIDIESELDGYFIVLENLDTPGVIGSVGALLGRQQINIARFSLGRQQRTASASSAYNAPNKALAIIQTDTPASAEVLEELGKIPAILSVASIVL